MVMCPLQETHKCVRPKEWKQARPHSPSFRVMHWESLCFLGNSGLTGAPGPGNQSGTLLPRETAGVLLNYMLGLLPGHFGLFVPMEQQVRRLTIMAGIIDPDQPEHEIGQLISCSAGQNSYATHIICFRSSWYPLPSWNSEWTCAAILAWNEYNYQAFRPCRNESWLSQHQVTHQDFSPGREAHGSSNIRSKGSMQRKGWTGAVMRMHAQTSFKRTCCNERS